MWTVTVVMVTVLRAAGADDVPGEPGTEVNREDVQLSVVREDITSTTDVVVASIRRQLMADNYDYMPSSSDEALPGGPPVSPAPTDPPATLAGISAGPHTPEETGGPPLGEHVNDIFIPRARDLDELPQEIPDLTDDPDPEGAVHKNDLLYYVHDDRLRAPDAEEDEELDPSPLPKYKVLKMKSASDTRRAGAQGRFLQEEWEGGVALISLDRRPFPQFRLPAARRQYMDPGSGLQAF